MPMRAVVETSPSTDGGLMWKDCSLCPAEQADAHSEVIAWPIYRSILEGVHATVEDHPGIGIL